MLFMPMNAQQPGVRCCTHMVQHVGGLVVSA